METKKIRQDLKNNFLKSLVFRIYFSGMMDADVEKFIQEIRSELLGRDYLTLKEEYEDIENLKLYVFSSEKGKELKISKSYILFEIDIEQNETLFSKYVPLISFIINELKKREYLQFDRIGLKKVNACILLNKYKLSDYFNNNVLCRFNNDSPVTQVADEFTIDQYNVKYNRRFQEGFFSYNKKRKTGYQIILDIEAYLEEFSVDEIIRSNNSKDILTKLNDAIFEIYISSLTDGFIQNLTKEDFIDENMLGVLKNV